MIAACPKVFHIGNCFPFLCFPMCLSNETTNFFCASKQSNIFFQLTLSIQALTFVAASSDILGMEHNVKVREVHLNLPLFKIVHISFHFLCYFVSHDGIHSSEIRTSLEVTFALKFHGSSKRSGKSSFPIPFSVLV